MIKDPEKLKGPKGPSSVNEFASRLRIVERKFNNRAEVAKAIGVAKSSYQRWVEGVSTPSFDAMAKLAKVAGVSLDWLAFGEESPSAGDAAHTGQQASLDEKLMFEIWSSIQGIVDIYRMKYSTYQHISLTCQIYESMKADPDKAEETRVKMLSVVEASIRGLLEDSDLIETADDQQSA